MLTPFTAQPSPPNLVQLTAALVQHWPMTNLLDILKETDLRVHVTEAFHTLGAREALAPDVLQRRLLLCLHGLGANAGLKRMRSGGSGETYADLAYVRRRYITKEQLRVAIAKVCDAIFTVRRVDLWGEGTTAYASDSKRFGAWDQNLMTEWHARYGGPGVMIYYHVERNSGWNHCAGRFTRAWRSSKPGTARMTSSCMGKAASLRATRPRITRFSCSRCTCYRSVLCM